MQSGGWLPDHGTCKTWEAWTNHREVRNVPTISNETWDLSRLHNWSWSTSMRRTTLMVSVPTRLCCCTSPWSIGFKWRMLRASCGCMSGDDSNIPTMMTWTRWTQSLLEQLLNLVGRVVIWEEFRIILVLILMSNIYIYVVEDNYCGRMGIQTAAAPPNCWPARQLTQKEMATSGSRSQWPVVALLGALLGALWVWIVG